MREKRCEKYCEMELISPTHVVRQASVKMAASRYAPGSPKSWKTMHRSVYAPFS